MTYDVFSDISCNSVIMHYVQLLLNSVFFRSYGGNEDKQSQCPNASNKLYSQRYALRCFRVHCIFIKVMLMSSCFPSVLCK